MQMLQCNFTQQTKTPVLRRFFVERDFTTDKLLRREKRRRCLLNVFVTTCLKFAAVEIKGETRIKTHTIPLLKLTAKQNVLRKR